MVANKMLENFHMYVPKLSKLFPKLNTHTSLRLKIYMVIDLHPIVGFYWIHKRYEQTFNFYPWSFSP